MPDVGTSFRVELLEVNKGFPLSDVPLSLKNPRITPLESNTGRVVVGFNAHLRATTSEYNGDALEVGDDMTWENETRDVSKIFIAVEVVNEGVIVSGDYA